MCANTACLSVSGLTKVFKGAEPVRAVDEVSFSLLEGQILGLLGPNGAGKTTTIQMLLSLLKPTSGSIAYFGRDLNRHRSDVLAKVGFASAYSQLPVRLTVEENLDVYGRLAGLGRHARKTKIDELLGAFDGLNLRKRPIASLSAGQRTRVVLCKAFIGSPRVVMLDEPTASLDPDVASEVRSFILGQRRNHGVSVVYTSHNMDEVAQVCDEVLFLSHGRILAHDSPSALAGSLAGSRVRLRISSGKELVEEICKFMGVTAAIEDLTAEIWLEEAKVADFMLTLSERGVRYSSISIDHPSLEDYFLHVAREAKEQRRGEQ